MLGEEEEIKDMRKQSSSRRKRRPSKKMILKAGESLNINNTPYDFKNISGEFNHSETHEGDL